MKNLFLAIALMLYALVPSAFSQSSAFTYQGKLSDAGAPANGPYDLTFKLFDLLSGGTQIGSNVVRDDVMVTDGIFNVTLDFGPSPFLSNTANYLEVSVRPGASTGSFTPLAPRQAITSSPYSIQTLHAASATNFSGSLGGDVVGTQSSTTVTRLQTRSIASTLPTNGQVLTWSNGSSQWEPATPALSPGSPSYIQNGIPPQPSSNFNISGTGKADIFDAITQYNIGSNRVLSVPGTNNFFAGVSAGENNSTGEFNAFIGRDAGRANTSGTGNAFVGTASGRFNTTGVNNAFVGGAAGQSNTTGGGNSFFGYQAGFSNTTAAGNSFIGATAGFSNTGSNNTFVGSAAGTQNTTASDNSFFGMQSGFLNTTGNVNSFFGKKSGFNNVNGAGNAFLGFQAGFANTSGNSNTFVGANSGNTNQTGGNNTIIGNSANTSANNLNFATAIGSSAVVASSDTIVLGKQSGTYNGVPRPADAVQIPGNLYVTGSLNATLPVGSTSYIQNTTSPQASSNFNISGNGTAAGTLSGNIVGATSQFNLNGTRILGSRGNNTLFVGDQAGINNDPTSNFAEGNTFIGSNAGTANFRGRSNTFVGAFAGTQTGTTAQGSANAFFGNYVGFNNTTGTGNAFFGSASAFSTTEATGFANTTGSFNAFLGHRSGEKNTTGTGNSFVGTGSGFLNTTGSSNTFFGHDAGNTNTIGSFNTIIGKDADVGAGDLNFAAAIGANAVVNTSDTVVIGKPSGTYGGVPRPADAVQIPGNLHVIGGLIRAPGGVFIANPNTIVITSPNGACWGITVSNAGALATFSTPCP